MRIEPVSLGSEVESLHPQNKLVHGFNTIILFTSIGLFRANKKIVHQMDFREPELLMEKDNDNNTAQPFEYIIVS